MAKGAAKLFKQRGQELLRKERESQRQERGNYTPRNTERNYEPKKVERKAEAAPTEAKAQQEKPAFKKAWKGEKKPFNRNSKEVPVHNKRPEAKPFAGKPKPVKKAKKPTRMEATISICKDLDIDPKYVKPANSRDQILAVMAKQYMTANDFMNSFVEDLKSVNDYEINRVLHKLPEIPAVKAETFISDLVKAMLEVRREDTTSGKIWTTSMINKPLFVDNRKIQYIGGNGSGFYIFFAYKKTEADPKKIELDLTKPIEVGFTYKYIPGFKKVLEDMEKKGFIPYTEMEKLKKEQRAAKTKKKETATENK